MPLRNERKDLNIYKYSLVQFHNIWTKEVLNIGLILIDIKDIHIHMPRKFDKLKSCLDFTEISGINYTLDIIEDRIKNQMLISYGEVSNSVYITESKTFLSEYSVEDALNEAIEKFMMIIKLREIALPDTLKNKYEKYSILKFVKEETEKHKIENYRSHTHYDNVAKKIIDMALVDEDQNPYVVGCIASLHTENFDDSFITASFTVQETMRSEIVKDQFLYVPKLKDILTAKETKNLGWAQEQAQHINVDIITDRRKEAIIERLGQYKVPDTVGL